MRILLYALLGIAVLLVLKYLVFGLDAWNKTLHPGRTDANTTFNKPLMGRVRGSNGCCC